jgi:hypothetical protein
VQILREKNVCLINELCLDRTLSLESRRYWQARNFYEYGHTTIRAYGHTGIRKHGNTRFLRTPHLAERAKWGVHRVVKSISILDAKTVFLGSIFSNHSYVS